MVSCGSLIMIRELGMSGRELRSMGVESSTSVRHRRLESECETGCPHAGAQSRSRARAQKKW